MNPDKVSLHPCPICSEQMFVTGKTKNNQSLTSCGHKFKFKKTRSAKVAEREWVRTPWGLERAEPVKA